MSLEQMARLSWLTELYRLSHAAASGGDSQGALTAMLRHITAGFGAKSGSLAIVAEGEVGALTIVAGIDLPEGVIGSRIPFGQGVLGRVAENGEAVLLNGDVREDQRFDSRVERARRPASAMCWPLRMKDRVIGALSLNRDDAEQPYTDEDLQNGSIMVNVLALVIDNSRMHLEQQGRIAALSAMNAEILEVNQRLKEAQSQLLQSEKMASIGQLAAGVAHEINNPVGYVYSNLGSLDMYLGDLMRLIEAGEALAAGTGSAEAFDTVRREIDLDFLREDILMLMRESREGLDRVKKIVQDLKDFSRVDQSEEWQWANLQDGLDSTLNIVNNEIKYKATVERRYATLPPIECLPSQLNQVFMNLLVNAAQAIPDHGTITVETGAGEEEVWVAVSDTGCGIPEAIRTRIFEPFFTTKPVGKGTGLGLSLSYSIVQKHGGRIEVDSRPGEGTTFRVSLPVRHATEGGAR